MPRGYSHKRTDTGLPHWIECTKADEVACKLADHHYSRRTPGSNQFMPPGETFCMVTRDGLAVWGWWRPHPDSGIKAMNGLDGWTCTIFRNTGLVLSSELIVEAEEVLRTHNRPPGPSGLLSYVWDKKLRSVNPGYCFKCAGYRIHPMKPKSADGRKTLLWKPWR